MSDDNIIFSLYLSTVKEHAALIISLVCIVLFSLQLIYFPSVVSGFNFSVPVKFIMIIISTVSLIILPRFAEYYWKYFWRSEL